MMEACEEIAQAPREAPFARVYVHLQGWFVDPTVSFKVRPRRIWLHGPLRLPRLPPGSKREMEPRDLTALSRSPRQAGAAAEGQCSFPGCPLKEKHAGPHTIDTELLESAFGAERARRGARRTVCVATA